MDNRGAIHAAGFVLPDLNAVLLRSSQAGFDPSQIVGSVLAEAHTSLLGADPLKAAKDAAAIGDQLNGYGGCRGCFANGFTAGMMIGLQLAMRAVELRDRHLVESAFGG